MTAGLGIETEVTHDTLSAAAEEVIEIRAQQDRLAAIATEAEDNLKALAKASRIASVQTPTGRVTITSKSRRTFDATRMAQLVTAEVFAMFTDPKVVTKRFDAAVELGVVDAEKVAAAIGETPYVELKVYA